MKFLRQIEKRGSCLDDFAFQVDATQETIAHMMNNFDFTHLRLTLSNIEKYAPSIQLTSRLTRTRALVDSEPTDEDQLTMMADEFVENFLSSLHSRFDSEAEVIIQSLSVVSCPSKLSPKELLENPLVQQYTSTTTCKHKAVDNQVYERTEPPLLDVKLLWDEVYAFLTIVGDLHSISSIMSQLVKHGDEQCAEWYRLYQLFATFAIGSNESERMFSALRRIKTWLRNRLSNTSLEILVKASSLDIVLTEDAINFIIDDFVRNPGRAKSRNVRSFFQND